MVQWHVGNVARCELEGELRCEPECEPERFEIAVEKLGSVPGGCTMDDDDVRASQGRNQARELQSALGFAGASFVNGIEQPRYTIEMLARTVVVQQKSNFRAG